MKFKDIKTSNSTSYFETIDDSPAHRGSSELLAGSLGRAALLSLLKQKMSCISDRTGEQATASLACMHKGSQRLAAFTTVEDNRKETWSGCSKSIKGEFN